MLSLTGQYIFAVLMALSQYVDPYSKEQVESFLKTGDKEAWQIEAYKFQPLPPHQLMMLSGDEMAIARYVRNACIRVVSSTQTQKSIDSGQLLDIDFEFIFSQVVSDDFYEKYQKRLLGEEQGIRLANGKDYLKRACDIKVPLEELADQNLHLGVALYLNFFRELPRIKSEKDLPTLYEASFVKNKQGQVLGDFSFTETDFLGRIVKRNRRLLPKKEIPQSLKKALVSIEDKNFWNFQPKNSKEYSGHKGVDLKRIAGAASGLGAGNLSGASTLTMQLAKNLLLYKDVFQEEQAGKRSLFRKLKEYILAKDLEKALSKDQILNWYLNTIHFGRQSQGIVMAARSYFGKDLDQLEPHEEAFLVSLPKFPNTYDETDEKSVKKFLKRRNKVLREMRKLKYLSKEDYKTYKKKELGTRSYKKPNGYADQYISAVQFQLREWQKEQGLNPNDSYEIEVPMEESMQRWAVQALQRQLLNFERNKKSLTVKPYEDALPNIKKNIDRKLKEKGFESKTPMEVYPEILSKIKNRYPDADQFEVGVVLSNTKLGTKSGKIFNRQVSDQNANLKKWKNGKKVNLEVWDTVLLQPFSKSDGGKFYRIASFPDVTGGIVVLNNLTGEVLATAGGFSAGVGGKYKTAVGNRAFSSKRQPGSTVKPFTYLYALMNGVSPSVVLPNRDVSLPEKWSQGTRLCDWWTPRGRSSEPSVISVRNALQGSVNRATLSTFIRASGITDFENVEGYASELDLSSQFLLQSMQSYGLYTDVQQICYPFILGGKDTSVYKMAGAYAAFANGGLYNAPHTIKTVFHKNKLSHPFGSKTETDRAIETMERQEDPSYRLEQINFFRLRTMLQGVVRSGTAARIHRKSKISWSSLVAGKTGTTNSNKDAWFVGFNKNITVAVWVGYPKGRKLGRSGTGARAALPIFKDFMEQYYKAYPEDLKNTFSTTPPAGTFVASVEPETGFLIEDSEESQFIKDYRYYTGKTDRPKGVPEFYASKEEFERAATQYEPNEVAGRYFFKNLSAEVKESFDLIYEKYLKFEFPESNKPLLEICTDKLIALNDYGADVPECKEYDNAKPKSEVEVYLEKNAFIEIEEKEE